MKLLFWIISLLITSRAFGQAIVTVTYSIPVTVIYKYEPTVLREYGEEGKVGAKQQLEAQISFSEDEGKINAKATISIANLSSMIYNTKTNTSNPQLIGSITDASGAFRMGLPFALGSAVVIILISFIF